LPIITALTAHIQGTHISALSFRIGIIGVQIPLIQWIPA